MFIFLDFISGIGIFIICFLEKKYRATAGVQVNVVGSKLVFSSSNTGQGYVYIVNVGRAYQVMSVSLDDNLWNRRAW